LPQGLPKKIQFQLLLADLALKLGHPRTRRLIIPHRLRPGRRRRALHGRPARPPSAPQHTFPPKLQPPLYNLSFVTPNSAAKASIGSPAINRSTAANLNSTS
jgi:hypothetical protein